MGQLEEMEARLAARLGYNCISEQGAMGVIWTVWDGTPSYGRRIASFAEERDAREYLHGTSADLRYLLEQCRRMREALQKIADAPTVGGPSRHAKELWLRVDEARAALAE